MKDPHTIAYFFMGLTLFTFAVASLILSFYLSLVKRYEKLRDELDRFTFLEFQSLTIPNSDSPSAQEELPSNVIRLSDWTEDSELLPDRAIETEDEIVIKVGPKLRQWREECGYDSIAQMLKVALHEHRWLIERTRAGDKFAIMKKTEK